MANIVRELQWLGKEYFWIIWSLITITLSTFTSAVFTAKAHPASPRRPSAVPSLSEGAFSSRAIIFLMLAFAAFYIAAMLVWEDFNYYDNSMFDVFTLRGHNYPPPITSGTGRFYPLSHQEFNILRLFTDTVTGYHALSIVELIILCLLLLHLDDEVPI